MMSYAFSICVGFALGIVFSEWRWANLLREKAASGFRLFSGDRLYTIQFDDEPSKHIIQVKTPYDKNN